MNNNLNSNHIIILFLIIVLLFLYNNKKETFKDFTKKFYNYNGLVNYNSNPYVYTEKTISELHLIITKILEQINQQTNSNLVLAKSVNNFDNITIDKLDKNKNRYLVDVFVNDIKADYTLRLMINFDYNNKSKKIDIIKINRSNALDFNDNNTIDYNEDIKCNREFVILPNNNISLEYSNLESKVNKELPIPTIYQQQILPHQIQDKNDNKNKNSCHKNVRCWDCMGIRNNNPNKCGCDGNQVIKKYLLDEPNFNPSIHKQVSNLTENSWLFSPTRLEIDKNL